MSNFDGLAVSSVTETSCVVSWNSDTPYLSRVDYGIDVKYGSTYWDEASLKTSHSHTITGLQPGTKYYFRACVYPEARNVYYFSSPVSTTTSPNLAELTDPLRLEHAVVFSIQLDAPTGTKCYSFDDLNLDVAVLP